MDNQHRGEFEEAQNGGEPKIGQTPPGHVAVFQLEFTAVREVVCICSGSFIATKTFFLECI